MFIHRDESSMEDEDEDVVEVERPIESYTFHQPHRRRTNVYYGGSRMNQPNSNIIAPLAGVSI